MITDKKISVKTTYIFILVAMLILVFILSLSLGSVSVSFGNIINALFGKGSSSSEVIIRGIRLPRVTGGLLAGVGLSVAGVVLQGVMNNALASPNTIGVGSGAGFFVMLSFILFPAKVWLQPLFAFGGALIATLLIFALAYFSDTSRITIILAGITVSSFLSAGINLLKTLNTDIAINLNSFLVGSLSGISFRDIALPSFGIITGFVIAVIMAKPLNMLGLGEDVARSLGLRVGAVRFILLVISSVLAGCVVSYAGLLSFAGLIVPHICRKLFGNDARLLIPCSAILGGSFVMLCDLLSRVVFAPYEFPAGIVMSFVGGPFFIYLLLRRKGGRRVNA
ncbi:MAG: iron ABC transporter permease [Lachnospiraceae bacterium]|nr:iron ABC transporter permease [Lachnospiraceae bacterium]